MSNGIVMAMTTTTVSYGTTGMLGNNRARSATTSNRKSAVELLAETKAFYVKSETVRGRTQTLPLVPRNSNHRARLSGGHQYPIVYSTAQPFERASIIAPLSRRSVSSNVPQTNADVLQNALRKLLDCSSPAISQENISNTCDVNSMCFELDAPISPPAEYAFCASERRYTRSHSHSQPTSGSGKRSSTQETVLAKSLPDLHTARTLSSSCEGSSSRCYTNKSATSDVFSLNRDSGGDSSGRLTHRSEPLGRRPAPELRRDSGSSTQHSGSCGPCQTMLYERGSMPESTYYDRDINSHYFEKDSSMLKGIGSYTAHAGKYLTNTQQYYDPHDHNKMIVSGVHHTPNYYCRVTKHGYPITPSYIDNKETRYRRPSSPTPLVLPPPPECCENTSFVEPIIPPPQFEMENEIYESLETKHVAQPSYNDNVSETSFHENVASNAGVFHENNNERENLATSNLPYQDPELSPGPGTFKRQKCFRYKQKSGTPSNSRPILRSKSDISDRYRRGTAATVVRKGCDGETSRSVSHLEQFFEQLGLNSDAYDGLIARSPGSSPVYFSDVSTVDSTRPVSPGPASGPPPRPGEPPSIVERNARIIKWLCNCRKAQMAAVGK